MQTSYIKILGGGAVTSAKYSLSSPGCRVRHLWGWLYAAFNRVDPDRVKQVGAERACAEWLLRSGASVRWCGQNHWLKDYNRLPQGEYRKHVIHEIDASDSCIMDMGFEHFKGLKALQKLILHQCLYISDSALSQLLLVEDTLQDLQITSCPGITEKGLYQLSQLKNLSSLIIHNLPLVNDMENVVEFLQKSLPKCDLHLTPHI